MIKFKFFFTQGLYTYHSGIAWLPPETVHYRQADEILQKRHDTLICAYNNDPVRFNGKQPKLRKLPEAVYINPPQIISISALQEEVVMA